MPALSRLNPACLSNFLKILVYNSLFFLLAAHEVALCSSNQPTQDVAFFAVIILLSPFQMSNPTLYLSSDIHLLCMGNPLTLVPLWVEIGRCFGDSVHTVDQAVRFLSFFLVNFHVEEILNGVSL